ncbi:hypothetical protein [Streptomyces swartbergensis]|uniref:hypothetical protein n=1 Tax=Streptomyces swartbergensis TaxID=487165 RepID=UPI001FCA0091|nr:hypothetical protein [Streptomyces swartbergensis]
MPTTVLEPVPLGVIARLNARTWLAPSEGELLPVLMLTYPAPQFDEPSPDVVEATMRHVAASLGTVAAGPVVPEVGVRLTLRGPDALLWFTDTAYALKIAHPRWTRAVNVSDRALLAVGLDELSPVATAAEVDEYREAARAAERMHLGIARVGRPIRGAK